MTMEMPVAWMRRITATASSISARVQPGQRLVEQQHRRLGRDRPGHLQLLALMQVERVRPGVGEMAETDRGQMPFGVAAGPGQGAPVRPNITAIATLSRTLIEANGLGIW